MPAIRRRTWRQMLGEWLWTCGSANAQIEALGDGATPRPVHRHTGVAMPRIEGTLTDLLVSINRRLLLHQQWCMRMAEARPQPLAMPESVDVWLGWEELLAEARTDLRRAIELLRDHAVETPHGVARDHLPVTRAASSS